MARKKKSRTKLDEFLQEQGFPATRRSPQQRTVGENDDLPLEPAGKGQYAFRRDPQMPQPVVGSGPKPEPKPDISHLLMDPYIMKMFVGVSLGAPAEDQPQKPTQIGLFSDGVFKTITTAVGRTVIKVADFKDEGLPVRPPSWQIGFHLLVPKIPSDLLFQTMAFFRAVAEKEKSEAFVSIWLEDSQYRIEVPEQEVSGAKVDHLLDPTAISGQQIMQIHSHVNMEAFWSGVDDADELQQGNLLYGVVGKINWDIPRSKWRTKAGKEFVDLDMSGLFQFGSYTVNHRLDGSKLVTGAGAENGITQQAVSLKPLEGVEFPAEWMEKVYKKTYMVVGTNLGCGVGNRTLGPYTLSQWQQAASQHLGTEKPNSYHPWWDDAGNQGWHGGGD